MALNANQFPSIYKALGIDLTKLGCVMLPLQTMAMPIVDLPTYKSNNEARFWINGWIAGTKAHATLLYGLLPNAHALEPHIREVLADWQRPESIDTFHVDYFDSPYPDEKYHCLIVHLDPRPLIEAHKRLNLLPHINTFPFSNQSFRSCGSSAKRTPNRNSSSSPQHPHISPMFLALSLPFTSNQSLRSAAHGSSMMRCSLCPCCHDGFASITLSFSIALSALPLPLPLPCSPATCARSALA